MQNNNSNNLDLLFRISELEEENRKLKQKTKYGLVWEDKPEKVVDDCNTKFPVLKVKEGKKFKETINDKNKPTNILIEGDNYHALSVLNYTHKNSIDVIYIDPPYNTGNEDFKYNDKFVDKEDSFSHSKWLSFINNRLLLCKNILKEDGLIFISIDDNSQSQLKMLCDKIFTENNFIGMVSVQSTPGGRQSSKSLAIMGDYVLVYGNSLRSKILGLPLSEKRMDQYDKEDLNGKFLTERLRQHGIAERREDVPTLYFPIYFNEKTNEISTEHKKGFDVEVLPILPSGGDGRWIWSRPKIEKDKNLIEIRKVKRKGTYIYDAYFKKYLVSTLREKLPTIWVESDLRTEVGSKELRDIFGGEKNFSFPKPTYFIKRLIQASTKSNEIILDFFAGSGTTGHAVLELNKEDGGNRQFIIVTNNENKICEEVTFERISRVINGYENKKGEKIEGLGGNLKYLETDFIDRTKHTDNMKMRLMRACTEMLCLKENAFSLEKEVEDGDTLMYKIFSGVKLKDGITKKHLIGIYYDLDDSYLDDMRADLKSHSDLDKSAYIFSLRNVDDFIDDYRKWKGINIEEIPQKILEIYEAILKNNSRNK